MASIQEEDDCRFEVKKEDVAPSLIHYSPLVSSEDEELGMCSGCGDYNPLIKFLFELIDEVNFKKTYKDFQVKHTRRGMQVLFLP